MSEIGGGGSLHGDSGEIEPAEKSRLDDSVLESLSSLLRKGGGDVSHNYGQGDRSMSMLDKSGL